MLSSSTLFNVFYFRRLDRMKVGREETTISLFSTSSREKKNSFAQVRSMTSTSLPVPVPLKTFKPVHLSRLPTFASSSSGLLWESTIGADDALGFSDGSFSTRSDITASKSVPRYCSKRPDRARTAMNPFAVSRRAFHC